MRTQECLFLAMLLGAAGAEGAGAPPKSAPAPAPAPIAVTVPRQGMSPATAVETPAGTLTFSFSRSGGGIAFDVGGLRPPANAVMQGTAMELSPVFEPGKFKTRHFKGERWKCVTEEKGKWVTESHDDLVTSREVMDPGKLQEDPAHFYAHLRGAVSASTERLRLRIVFPKAPPLVFMLQMESPFTLPPAVAEMLKQYQKISPAAEASEGRWDKVKFLRVRKNVCNDTLLAEELFDAAAIQTLAFPSHDWRLSTAHGWVLAEPIESRREIAISPAIDFTRLDPKNMTYLGDLYSRELIGVETSPGKATVTFTLGDFSGCFGASCGTPVDLRDAVVTFANGSLSTRIVRQKPASGE